MVRAAGVDIDADPLRPRRGALPARRRDPERRHARPSCAASTPSCSARSAPPRCRPGVIERGLLLKMRFELDLYVNQRPFVGTAPGHTEPHDFVVIRENTEGPYVGEGGVLRKGTPHEVATQGSVNTRMGAERAIRYAFELAVSRDGQARHAGAQDQRAHLRRRPVAAGVQRRRCRVPRRGHRLQPRRRRMHLLRAGPASVRRGRDRQPVRRHPHRPRRRGQWGHRAGQQRQPQPGPHRAEHVRARARLGARHRRDGQGEPHGGDPDARRSCSTSWARTQRPTASAPPATRRVPAPPARSVRASLRPWQAERRRHQGRHGRPPCRSNRRRRSG